MTGPFIDLIEFTAEAGRGGDGCTSFQSDPNNPHGGPDGGDGGHGGNVILKADKGLGTFAELSYTDKVKATDGENGGPNRQRGADGTDEIIEVPPGTVVKQLDTGEILGELTEDGETLLVAEGGKGGRGNRCFVSSDRQVPRFHEYGTAGERVPLQLELKLLADVGILGAPNAGKSTLLAGLTQARPEIAAHPFTTKSPNLGVVFKNHERITLCDIPGLIEDAHIGAGLGFQFLRHAERTTLFLHVIDASARDPISEYKQIRHEIGSYSTEMLEKPTVIVFNKIDKIEPGMMDIIRSELSDPPGPVIGVSAQEGTGLRRLKDLIWFEVSENESAFQAEQEDSERVVEMEQREPIQVFRVEDRFLLKGDDVKDLISRFDLSNPEAQSYVRSQLIDLGLHKKLENAGCKPGDMVQVGSQEFRYTG